MDAKMHFPAHDKAAERPSVLEGDERAAKGGVQARWPPAKCTTGQGTCLIAAKEMGTLEFALEQCRRGKQVRVTLRPACDGGQRREAWLDGGRRTDVANAHSARGAQMRRVRKCACGCARTHARREGETGERVRDRGSTGKAAAEPWALGRMQIGGGGVGAPSMSSETACDNWFGASGISAPFLPWPTDCS